MWTFTVIVGTSDKDKEETMDTSEGPKEAEEEESQKKLVHDVGEGNIATAAAAALASAATKAKVGTPASGS